MDKEQDLKKHQVDEKGSNLKGNDEAAECDPSGPALGASRLKKDVRVWNAKVNRFGAPAGARKWFILPARSHRANANVKPTSTSSIVTASQPLTQRQLKEWTRKQVLEGQAEAKKQRRADDQSLQNAER